MAVKESHEKKNALADAINLLTHMMQIVNNIQNEQARANDAWPEAFANHIL